MTAQTVKRVLNIYESTVRELSDGQPFPDVIYEIRTFVALLDNALEALSSQAKVESILSGLEEPTEEQIERAEALAKVAALTLHKMLKSKVLQAVKELPNAPGGRPVKVISSEREAVCAAILSLVGQGLTVAAAKRRVALKRKVSTKTIDRTWADRTKSETEQLSDRELGDELHAILMQVFQK